MAEALDLENMSFEEIKEECIKFKDEENDLEEDDQETFEKYKNIFTLKVISE